MNAKARLRGRILTLGGMTIAVLAALIVLSGCGKQEAPTQDGHEGHEHASVDQPAAPAQTQPTEPTGQTLTVSQTTCPIMEGNPINKNIFVEYKGKKVYFCCKGCPDIFNADPEKYVSKLPQFQN